MIRTNSAQAAIGGGINNVVDNYEGTIPGGDSAKAAHYGEMAFASGPFVNPGDAQTSTYILRGITTTATPLKLSLDGGNSFFMTVPVNSAWTFDILVVALNSSGSMGNFHIVGAIKNNGTVSIPSFTKDIINRDVAGWDATVGVNSGALSISVTGDTSNVRWVATVRTVQVMR